MMVRSPWDGHDRAPLRVALAVVVALDAAVVAYFVSDRPRSAMSHPLAPEWLLWLGGRPGPAIALAVLAAIAAARFASRPRAAGAGIALLVISGLLDEALGALYEGPMRAFFSSGATLLGWVAGLLYAERLGDRAKEPRRAEALAEIGACAGLAATYVGAVFSKLSRQGLSWTDATNLQGMIVSQQRLDRPLLLQHYSDLVARSPSLAFTLAALALVAQASMIVYPWSPRGRAASAMLVLAFHVNVALLTPIVFLSPMLLLAVFSFPWPRIGGRLRGRAAAEAPPDVPAHDMAPERARRTAIEAAVVGAILVLIAWLSPIRAYTALHHDGRHRPPGHEASPSPPPADVAALLGGIELGDSIASLKVVRVAVRERAVSIELQGAGGASMRVKIARTGVLGFHAPRATEMYELFYESMRGVDDAARDAVLDVVEERLRKNERAVLAPQGL